MHRRQPLCWPCFSCATSFSKISAPPVCGVSSHSKRPKIARRLPPCGGRFVFSSWLFLISPRNLTDMFVQRFFISAQQVVLLYYDIAFALVLVRLCPRRLPLVGDCSFKFSLVLCSFCVCACVCVSLTLTGDQFAVAASRAPAAALDAPLVLLAVICIGALERGSLWAPVTFYAMLLLPSKCALEICFFCDHDCLLGLSDDRVNCACFFLFCVVSVICPPSGTCFSCRVRLPATAVCFIGSAFKCAFLI